MDFNKIKMATTVDHELFDGTKVKCTLAMIRLLRLKSNYGELYETVMRLLSDGTGGDGLDQIRTVYAAYLCANMDEVDKAELLTEEEFITACGSDYAGIGNTLRALIDPKKRMAFAPRSN